MIFTGQFGASRFSRHFPITLGKMLQPKARNDCDRELPYLRAANIGWGRISGDLKSMWFSPQERIQYSVQAGDLVVLEGGDVGRASIVPPEYSGLGIQNSVHRVQPSSLGSVHFALYWLQHLKSAGYFDLVCSKATLAHFTLDKFKAAPFPRLDLDTQKAIADFLDKETARIDQLIEKKQRFLRLLGDKKTTLLCHLLGKGEVGGAGDWLANCPIDWPRRRAKFAFRERDARSADGSEELLTVSHLTGVSRRAEKDVNMFLAETNVGYKKVSPGDFVINTMWAWMGAMGVSDLEGIISPAYGVYRPVGQDFEPRYFDHLCRSKPFIAEATRRSKGIHSSRLRLYPDAFLDMRIPVPPTPVQIDMVAEFDRQISHEQALRGLTETSIERLKEYRSALITAAVTGQIDVTRWGRTGEGDRRLDQIQEEMAG